MLRHSKTATRQIAVFLLGAVLLGCVPDQADDAGVNAAETAAVTAQSPEHKADDAPEAILAAVMALWPGDYANQAQLAHLLQQGLPIWRADGSGEGGHIEVVSHYRPVHLPAFGEHVLYVEETKHGEPDLIFRQRIYTLVVNPDRQQVQVKLWNFKDKEAYVGAWRDLKLLDGLTPEQMSGLPDKCDLFVQRDEHKWHMLMDERACAFGDRYFNYQVLLGEDSFWFRDQIVSLEDDTVLESAGDFTYHELDRIDE